MKKYIIINTFSGFIVFKTNNRKKAIEKLRELEKEAFFDTLMDRHEHNEDFVSIYYIKHYNKVYNYKNYNDMP